MLENSLRCTIATVTGIKEIPNDAFSFLLYDAADIMAGRQNNERNGKDNLMPNAVQGNELGALTHKSLKELGILSPY